MTSKAKGEPTKAQVAQAILNSFSENWTEGQQTTCDLTQPAVNDAVAMLNEDHRSFGALNKIMTFLFKGNQNKAQRQLEGFVKANFEGIKLNPAKDGKAPTFSWKDDATKKYHGVTRNWMDFDANDKAKSKAKTEAKLKGIDAAKKYAQDIEVRIAGLKTFDDEGTKYLLGLKAAIAQYISDQNRKK
jgi:hypothetical protein